MGGKLGALGRKLEGESDKGRRRLSREAARGQAKHLPALSHAACSSVPGLGGPGECFLRALTGVFKWLF